MRITGVCMITSSYIAFVFHQSFRLTSARSGYWTTNYMIAIEAVQSLPLSFSLKQVSQQLFPTSKTPNTALLALISSRYWKIKENTNMWPKAYPKSSKLSSIHPPSKVWQTVPPTTQIIQQPSRQCIPSSEWLLNSWPTASMFPIGQRAPSGRINNVIVLLYPGHILISNYAILMTGTKTKSICFGTHQSITAAW
jgi:hypothetical protein